MIESSKDILYVVIAAAIIILTFFLSWGLFYIVMMLKKMNALVGEIKNIIDSVKEKLERVESLFRLIEEKVRNSASYLPLLLKAITELIEHFRKKRQQRKEKTNQKKNP